MAQAGHQEGQHRLRGAKLQVEIPVADAMMKISKIPPFRARSRASAGHKSLSKVMHGTSRIIPKPIAGVAETHRKIALLPVRAPLVVLIHAAERQKQVTPYRNVSRHHEGCLTFTGIIFAEMHQPTKLAGKGLGTQSIYHPPFPFQHRTGHPGSRGPSQRLNVGLQEIRTDADIVIKKENKVTSRRKRTGVPGA
jgi:hypothetical protein